MKKFGNICLKVILLTTILSMALQGCGNNDKTDNFSNYYKLSKIEEIAVSTKINTDLDLRILPYRKGYLILNISQNQINYIDKDGDLIETIGRVGRGPGEFSELRGMAIDESNSIYIYDLIAQNITVFDSTGRYKNTNIIGIQGQELEYCDGNFYLFNSYAVRPRQRIISKIDGNSLEKISAFYKPTAVIQGLGIPANGIFNNLTIYKDKLYVAHPMEAIVYLFDLKGNLLKSFPISSSIYQTPNYKSYQLPAPIHTALYAIIESLFIAKDTIYITMRKIEKNTSLEGQTTVLELYDLNGNKLNKKSIYLPVQGRALRYIDQKGVFYYVRIDHSGQLFIEKYKLVEVEK